MNLEVDFEITTRSESFTTYLTLKWLFSRVNSHVAFEFTTLSKSFTAYLTLKRLFARVNSHVLFEITTPSKSFTTYHTVVKDLLIVVVSNATCESIQTTDPFSNVPFAQKCTNQSVTSTATLKASIPKMK